MAVAIWVRISVEIESNELYPALNRRLTLQHGSDAKELTGLALLVISNVTVWLHKCFDGQSWIQVKYRRELR